MAPVGHRLQIFTRLLHKCQTPRAQSSVPLRSIYPHFIRKRDVKKWNLSDFLCLAGSLLWHSEIFLFCNWFGHEVKENTSGILLGPALRGDGALLWLTACRHCLFLKAAFSVPATAIKRKGQFTTNIIPASNAKKGALHLEKQDCKHLTTSLLHFLPRPALNAAEEDAKNPTANPQGISYPEKSPPDPH